MRTVPCTELGCSRCREGRGGFQFPFVGTFAKRSIIVAAGATPAQAWHSYHQDGPERLSIELVFELGSGLWPTDFLPDHANRLIQNVCLERDLMCFLDRALASWLRVRSAGELRGLSMRPSLPVIRRLHSLNWQWSCML